MEWIDKINFFCNWDQSIFFLCMHEMKEENGQICSIDILAANTLSHLCAHLVEVKKEVRPPFTEKN